MNQRSPIKICEDELYSKGPRKIFVTNQTEVYFIDDSWSLHI